MPAQWQILGAFDVDSPSFTHLSLFSGIEGFSLGLSRAISDFRTVCYVEKDSFCVEVLKARIRDGRLDDAPIWDDIKTFDGDPWRGVVDCITGGFPCQPFSLAGKRKGQVDERNCWPDTIRIINEVRPNMSILENVPGLLSSGYFGRILSDLAEGGYDAIWKVLSAAEVGAAHKRDRVWIMCWNVAYARCKLRKTRLAKSTENQPPTDIYNKRCGQNVANAEKQFCDVSHNNKKYSSWWAIEPNVGRVAYGIPDRVDRLKALGNAVVPAVVSKIWRIVNEP